MAELQRIVLSSLLDLLYQITCTLQSSEYLCNIGNGNRGLAIRTVVSWHLPRIALFYYLPCLFVTVGEEAYPP